MKRILTISASLLVFCMACLMFGQAKESSKNALTGTWDCVAHLSGEDDIPFTMTLEQNDHAITGSIATHEGDLQVKSGSFKDGAMELHLETQEAKYAVSGKFDGDQLKGQWSKDPDGIGGAWEGKRSTAAKPSAH